jgi:hypothetical protein
MRRTFGSMGTVERSRWTRVAARPDLPLDLLDARFVHHRFAPHAHEEFSIGVCSEGVEVLDYRGAKWHASPGTVLPARRRSPARRGRGAGRVRRPGAPDPLVPARRRRHPGQLPQQRSRQRPPHRLNFVS